MSLPRSQGIGNKYDRKSCELYQYHLGLYLTSSSFLYLEVQHFNDLTLLMDNILQMMHKISNQLNTQIASFIILIQAIQMDFKLRQSRPLPRILENTRPDAQGIANSRRTNQTSNGLSQKFQFNRTESIRLSSTNNTGLNRFIKKAETGAAPKNQFKKYLLEGSNVFYQNRPGIKQLQKLRYYKKLLIVIWVLLSTSYFIIGRLDTYKGICPKMAKCGVFINCPEYYQLSQDQTECSLSSDLIDEVQQILEEQVYSLQRTYGDSECSELAFPSLNIETMFDEAKDTEKAYYYKKQASKFFKNQDNQHRIGFQIQKGHVFPTRKIYSLSCQLQIKLKQPAAIIAILFIVLGLLLLAKLVIWIRGRILISNMYQFLKQKVISAPNKILNVTHTMAELESKYGPMNEQIWAKINDLRTKDRQIGYYQEDFLYWKMSS